MNIFVLDKNPVKAARMLCDKHIVKMIVESTQMLCTAHWMTGGKAFYKATYKNHPCTKWVRKTLGNYKWLVRHALEMCKEYKRRYTRIHKCQETIEWCKENLPDIKKGKLTEFAQAMPKKYKNKSAVKAYRDYYLHEKLRFCRWNHSKEPDFVKKYKKKKII